MPLAVLAEIGGRALGAMIGGGPVVIGEGAGGGAGPVIVEVADVVGQPPIGVVVVVMMPVVWVDGGIRRKGGGEGHDGQGCGGEKLHFLHLRSPGACR